VNHVIDEKILQRPDVSSIPAKFAQSAASISTRSAFASAANGQFLKSRAPAETLRLEAEDAKRRARELEEARRRRRQWADIPEMFSAATLKGYRRVPGTEEAFEAVKNYLLNREENFRTGRGLILMGAVGCGKTHLGCAILNCALQDGYRAVYWNVPQQLEMMMYGHSDEEEQVRILDKAILAQVLLLDDLGAEKSSEWTRKELMVILDERYRNNKPTIITSNLMLTDNELRKTCGDRAYSRLCSDHYKAVALTAGDYRRRKA
jgi:DNA replication protein DnaC